MAGMDHHDVEGHIINTTNVMVEEHVQMTQWLGRERERCVLLMGARSLR